jgi:hypothetical protein
METNDFIVKHKGIHHKYHSSDHQPSPKASIVSNRDKMNVYQCEDEKRTYFEQDTDSIVYDYQQCVLKLKEYRSHQKYFRAMNVVCGIDSEEARIKLNMEDKKQYSDKNFDYWIEKLDQAMSAQPSCKEFIDAYINGNHLFYYSNLLKAKEDCESELRLRKYYQENCICIGNEGHKIRVETLEKMVDKLQTFFTRLLTDHAIAKNYPRQPLIDKSITVGFFSVDPTLQFSAYDFFHSFCCVSDVSVRKNETCALTYDILSLQLQQYLPFFIAFENGKQTMDFSDIHTTKILIKQRLQEMFQGFYNDHKQMVLLSLDRYSNTLLRDVLSDIEIFHEFSIECVVKDNGIPIEVILDFKRISRYIEETHHLKIPPDLLKEQIKDTLKSSAYQTCFQNYKESNEKLLLTLCKRINQLKIDPDVKTVLHPFCPNLTQTLQQINLNSKLKPLLQGVWKSISNSQTSKSGGKFSGTFSADISKMSFATMIRLFEAFQSKLQQLKQMKIQRQKQIVKH